MENKTLGIIVVIVGVIVLLSHGNHIGAVLSGGAVTVQPAQAIAQASDAQTGASESASGSASGDVQTFALSSRSGQYNPAEIRVKQGTKVRIIGDPRTLSGCMEVVNIEGYGISKRITPTDYIIEFTADKPGVFPMYCNMGIGNGKLVVE